MKTGRNDRSQSVTRYRISHRTEYRYSAPVAMCQNQLRMTPSLGERTRVIENSLNITPSPDTLRQHQDYFGNQVVTFAIEAIHRSLVVESISKLDLIPRDYSGLTTTTWRSIAKAIEEPVQHHLLNAAEYALPSPQIQWHQGVHEYGRESFEKSDSLQVAALDLTKRIHSDFKYDSKATNVSTTVREVFDLRAGVCQDFAQFQIACFRAMGLPARYVSGYLRTLPPPGKEKLIGADESHAWCSVFTGNEHGWLDLDPTNGCQVASDHIPICVGRDYLDVSPMRGLAIGGGTPTLNVSVDVAELA
ncbi:MAG: transglutaminase N-terminal domain-containing protein [Aureliella sp.]